MQVPMVRQAILDSVPDWTAFTQRQQDTVFAPGEAGSATAHRRRDKMLAAIDFLCSSADDKDADSTATDQVRVFAIISKCHTSVQCFFLCNQGAVP